MEATLTRFVRALRMANVRVSTAETLDALRVVQLVGWGDREQLKHALAAALAKSAYEVDAFETCFERFFRFDTFTADHSIDNATESDTTPASDDAQTGPENPPAVGDGAAGAGGAQANGTGGGAGSDSGGPPPDREYDLHALDRSALAKSAVDFDAGSATSPLGRLLLADDQTAIAMAISQAAREHRLEDIKVFTQQGLYTRRIMDSMGRPALIDEMIALDASTDSADRQLGAALRSRHDRLRRQIRDHVEGQFLLHADARGERLRMQMLHNARLGNIPPNNDHLVRRMIERMARQLVAVHSRKRRVTRRGTLDVSRMIRRNMRHDAHMVELAWKSTYRDRPRVFVLCDVSGSVAYYARFMLMFLYSLGEVISEVRSFAFCSALAEVTDLFQRYDLDEASQRTLAAHGQGGTDYAAAFADFEQLALDDVDRRSTVLILGDARNNHGDPRTDLLRKIHDRCQRLIWLNPEPRAAWDSGDSEMGRYAAHCHQVSACGSLAQLERVVSDLLRRVG